jgi:DNA-binding transcriptional regulator YiaG
MKYKSDAYEAIYEDAVSMYEIGAISRERMKEYDEMCLVQEANPVIYKSSEKSAERFVRVAEHVTV